MSESESGFRAARQLLNGGLSGILATQSREMPGYPFGSLMPYSLLSNGWPLLLMSHLSKHTRNLNAEPRCSLTVTQPGEGDVQQLSRLCCLGDITPLEPTAEIIRRHFRYFPDSRVYHEQLNFHFYTLVPRRFYFVGGFGAARWMGVDHLTRSGIIDTELEIRLIQQLNRMIEAPEQSDGIQALRKGGPVDQIIGLDVDGIDIRRDEIITRYDFNRPLNPESSSEEIINQAANRLTAP